MFIQRVICAMCYLIMCACMRVEGISKGDLPVIALAASFSLSSPSPYDELCDSEPLCPLWTAADCECVIVAAAAADAIPVAPWLWPLVDSSYIDSDIMLCLIIDDVMLEDMLCSMWKELISILIDRSERNEKIGIETEKEVNSRNQVII